MSIILTLSFFLLCINFNEISTKSETENFLKLPFRSLLNESYNFFYEYYNKRILESEIKLGSNKQIIPLQLSFTSYTLFCISKEGAMEGILYYDSGKSKTFKMEKRQGLLEQKYSLGYKAYDTVEIGNLKMSNFTFVLAQTVNYDRFRGNGLLGLRLRSFFNNIDEEANIIVQLFKKKIILNYGFFFHFTNKDIDTEEGYLYLGLYPHQIWPKIYNKDYYSTYYFQQDSYSDPYSWQLKFNKISYGTQNLLMKEVKLEIDKGLMYAPGQFIRIMEEEFFNGQAKCYRYNNNTMYISSYYCDEEVDISSIKPLRFYFDEENYFVFNPEDMFINLDGFKYFIFIFSSVKNYWIFGSPFFKKYEIVFDQERKTVGYYFKNNLTDNGFDDDYFNEKSNKNKDNAFKIINIFFLSIISVSLIIIIINKYKNRRKIRANELEDLYEYKSSNNQRKNKENNMYEI